MPSNSRTPQEHGALAIRISLGVWIIAVIPPRSNTSGRSEKERSALLAVAVAALKLDAVDEHRPVPGIGGDEDPMAGAGETKRAFEGRCPIGMRFEERLELHVGFQAP